MTEKSPQSDEMRRYMLGRLSEQEQEAFDLRYVGDPALLEEVQSLRDELLDGFLSGALEPDEHELLTTRLARSAVWREKVATLQALRDLAHEFSPRYQRWATHRPTLTLSLPPRGSGTAGLLSTRQFVGRRWRQAWCCWAWAYGNSVNVLINQRLSLRLA